MARLRMPPFPVLPDNPDQQVVFLSPWELTATSSGSAEHWDYKVDLDCVCTAELGIYQLREACLLPSDARIGVFAEWSTSLSPYARSRGDVTEIPLCDDDPVTVSIRVPVRGMESGGTLSLEIFLVVLEVGTPQAGGPQIPGAILWRHETRKILESPGSRIPVSVVDFSKFPERFEHHHAAWSVSIAPEGLHVAPSVGLQIYVNSFKAEIVALVTEGGDDVAAVLARQMIYYDVGRQLLAHALANEEFCDETISFAEGTLGASLRLKVGALFPSKSIEYVASMLRTDPRVFDDVVQGNFFTEPSS